MKSVFKGSMVRFVVLFAAVILSQSIGDMSLIKTSRLASGVTLLTEASESGRTKALSSNQGKDRKDIEVALSETRHTTNRIDNLLSLRMFHGFNDITSFPKFSITVLILTTLPRLNLLNSFIMSLLTKNYLSINYNSFQITT